METKALMIIEIMGRPPEHIKKTLEDLLEKLDSEKGVSVTSKKIHDPKVVEKKDKEGNLIKMPKGHELYSSFAEIQIETDTIMHLINIMFAYMPSHVEIISPKEFEIPNFDMTHLINEITKRMHRYDAIAKSALVQNQALVNKLKEMQGVSENSVKTKTKKKATKKTKTKKSKKK